LDHLDVGGRQDEGGAPQGDECVLDAAQGVERSVSGFFL
jgi:hypothetical protein